MHIKINYSNKLKNIKMYSTHICSSSDLHNIITRYRVLLRWNLLRGNLTMHFRDLPKLSRNCYNLYISLMQYRWPWLDIYFVCPFQEGNYASISKLVLVCTPHCQNSNWNIYLPLVSFRSYNVSCLPIYTYITVIHSSNTCHFDLGYKHESYYIVYVLIYFLFLIHSSRLL